jgi:hypothetical protein
MATSESEIAASDEELIRDALDATWGHAIADHYGVDLAGRAEHAGLRRRPVWHGAGCLVCCDLTWKQLRRLDRLSRREAGVARVGRARARRMWTRGEARS